MDKPFPFAYAETCQNRNNADAPVLLLLHGVGGSEEDLLDFADAAAPGFRCLCLRAPFPIGRGSYAWFRVEFGPAGPSLDAVQADSSLDGLLEFIDAVRESYGTDKVYLGGFSQGAIMSLGAALAAPEKVAGAVAMSGRIPAEFKVRAVSPERLSGLGVLVVHGLGDQVLPVRHGRESKAYLETLPVDLSYQEFPMDHSISAASLGCVRSWLSARAGLGA